MKTSTTLALALLLGVPLLAADAQAHRDRDDNPPGLRGGPGTNWENPPGWRGGPGRSPDTRLYGRWHGAARCVVDFDHDPPGPRGGPGTNWENPPGWRGGPGASPDRRGRCR